jgi:hypothetical protein
VVGVTLHEYPQVDYLCGFFRMVGSGNSETIDFQEPLISVSALPAPGATIRTLAATCALLDGNVGTATFTREPQWGKYACMVTGHDQWGKTAMIEIPNFELDMTLPPSFAKSMFTDATRFVAVIERR